MNTTHPDPSAAAVETHLAAARELVSRAAAAGVVITIEQQSVSPLAMGNVITVVSARPARKAQ